MCSLVYTRDYNNQLSFSFSPQGRVTIKAGNTPKPTHGTFSTNFVHLGHCFEVNRKQPSTHQSLLYSHELAWTTPKLTSHIPLPPTEPLPKPPERPITEVS